MAKEGSDDTWIRELKAHVAHRPIVILNLKKRELHGLKEARDGMRQIQRDNAHTLPLLMTQAPPPAITAEQLRSVQVPVCVAQGAQTRPVFGVVARAAAQAMPWAHHLVIEDAHHMWPDEQPAAFCDALESFWSAEIAPPRAGAR